MIRKLVAIAFWALAVLLSTTGSYAQTKFRFQRVAHSGDPAPVPSQLGSISSFSFNDQGQAAFIGDNGLLLKSAGGVAIIAGFGQPAPGGGRFISAETPSLNNQGQIVFRADVSSPGTSGLFLFSGGTITQLVADGSLASTGESVFTGAPSVNDPGDVVFADKFTGTIFLFSKGTLTRLVAPQDPVPGGGDTFAFFTSPSINRAGQVVFIAFVSSSGSNGVYVASSGGGITRIVASGDVLADGSTFSGVFSPPSINDSGEVAFGGAASSPDARGLYVFSGGHTQLAVPESFVFSVSHNNGGQTAFAGLTPSGLGIFLLSSGAVTPIATAGQVSPDGDIFNLSVGLDTRVNNSGQVLFIFGLNQHTGTLYMFSNNQLGRVAGNGDPIGRIPTLEFPFALGISLDDNALISDSIFPGGPGLYTAAPRHGLTLTAHVGQAAGNSGAITTIFSSAMNQHGQIAILADTSGGRDAVLLSSAGMLTTVADNSSNVNPVLSPNGIALNNQGDIVFSGFEPQTGSFGLFLSSAGKTTKLIDGSTPFDSSGRTLNDLENLSLNDQGDAAFMARFPGSTVFYRFSQGTLIPVAADGDPAPGGGQFNIPLFGSRFGPVINNLQEVVFASFLSTGGTGVFVNRAGVISKIAAPGDRAPDGGSFTTADAPVINAAGQIAFSGQTTKSGSGIFLYSRGKIREVARSGSRIGKDRLLRVDLPQINDHGNIAFTADLADDETAVFVARLRSEQDEDPSESDMELDSPASRDDVARLKARDSKLLSDRVGSKSHHHRKPAVQASCFLRAGLSGNQCLAEF